MTGSAYAAAVVPPRVPDVGLGAGVRRGSRSADSRRLAESVSAREQCITLVIPEGRIDAVLLGIVPDLAERLEREAAAEAKAIAVRDKQRAEIELLQKMTARSAATRDPLFGVLTAVARTTKGAKAWASVCVAPSASVPGGTE
jgi:hypothetical protein